MKEYRHMLSTAGSLERELQLNLISVYDIQQVPPIKLPSDLLWKIRINIDLLTSINLPRIVLGCN